MNYGRFFVLDLEASDITQGISVFNYRGVKYKKDDGKCEDKNDTPEYPIYASFTSGGVFFYAHFTTKKKEEKDEPEIIHQNSLILSLPVSSNFEVKDNLTHHLNAIFRIAFPVNSKEDHIYNLIKQNIKSSEKQNKDITYSSLEIFGINYRKPQKDNPPIFGFIRKLFLDFLYDLKHTNVFENAANYDDIYIKLHENFLFSAIINKAEYYYLRKQQIKAPTADHPWDIAYKKLFYAEYYSNAEQKWIETITNPKAERCFYESEWFSDVETEMNQVYLSGTIQYTIPTRKGYRPEVIKSEETKCCNEYVSDIIIKKGNTEDCFTNTRSEKTVKDTLKSSAKIASNWYIKKYSFSGTTKIWYGKNYKWAKFIIALFIFSLGATLLLPSFDDGIMDDQIIPPVKIISCAFLLWLLSLINPKKRYIRTIGYINLLMPRLFASIVAAWFTLAIGEDIFKGFFDSEHKVSVSLCLLVVLVIFIYHEIGKINPYIDRTKRLRRSLMLMVVAFSYAFITGILIINFFGGKYLERSEYIDKFYANRVYTAVPDYTIDSTHQPQLINDVFYRVLQKYNDTLIPSLVLCSANQDKTYPLPVKDKKGNYLGDIDYRLTTLLVKQFIQEDCVVRDNHEKIQVNFTIKNRVSRVVDYYCHSIKNNIIPIDSNRYNNTMCLDLLKIMDNHQIYSEVLKDLKPVDKNKTRILSKTKMEIWIFRDMLLQFTFFAMFIGIFIQLIFEEKPITEPV